MEPVYICLTCKTVIGPVWDDFENKCKCAEPYDYEVVRVAPVEESIPIELNDETRFILGRPNFWCGSVAPIFREGGHTIPKKAEDEQAHIIHWMLGLYAKHGDGWKEKANEYLNSGAKSTQ